MAIAFGIESCWKNPKEEKKKEMPPLQSWSNEAIFIGMSHGSPSDISVIAWQFVFPYAGSATLCPRRWRIAFKRGNIFFVCVCVTEFNSAPHLLAIASAAAVWKVNCRHPLLSSTVDGFMAGCRQATGSYFQTLANRYHFLFWKDCLSSIFSSLEEEEESSSLTWQIDTVYWMYI